MGSTDHPQRPVAQVQILRRLLHSAALTFVLAAVATMAVGESCFLYRTNVSLAEANQQLKQQERADSSLAVGDNVQELVGYDRSARRRSIVLTGPGRALVFGISSGCPACEESLPGFRRLAAAAESQGMAVAFVSRDYLRQMARGEWATLPGAVISEPTYRTYRTLKLQLVPQVVVISEGGRVEAAEVGALTAAKEQSLLRIMGVLGTSERP